MTPVVQGATQIFYTSCFKRVLCVTSSGRHCICSTMLRETRDQASTVFVQWSLSTNLFCKWRFFALSSASWRSREWQLNFVLKPVKVLLKRSNWLIRLMVALPWVVLMCIGGMLACILAPVTRVWIWFVPVRYSSHLTWTSRHILLVFRTEYLFRIEFVK